MYKYNDYRYNIPLVKEIIDGDVLDKWYTVMPNCAYYILYNDRSYTRFTDEKPLGKKSFLKSLSAEYRSMKQLNGGLFSGKYRNTLGLYLIYLGENELHFKIKYSNPSNQIIASTVTNMIRFIAEDDELLWQKNMENESLTQSMITEIFSAVQPYIARGMYVGDIYSQERGLKQEIDQILAEYGLKATNMKGVCESEPYRPNPLEDIIRGCRRG